MGQNFGYYFASFYPFFALTFSLIIFIRRDHPFIRCRNPLFLITQNIGSVISCIILSIYIGKKPDYPCSLFYVGLTTSYSLFAIPLLLRTWEYCVNFHVSLLKLHYRASYYLNWKKTSWVYDHRWVGSRKFLNKALFGIMLVMSTPAIVAAFPSQFGYNDVAVACVMKGGAIFFGFCGGLIFLLVAVGMGFLIYRSQDVYKIKRELIILAILWLCVLVAFLAYTSPPREVLATYPPAAFIIIGYVLTLLQCNAVPLYYAHRFDKLASGSKGSLNHFMTLLESVEFRNKFHDFLTKQFCQENLQFYEVVNEWKSLRTADPDRGVKARAIIDVFVIEGSVCQVHMKEEHRERIMREAYVEDQSTIPLTLFDAALTALVEDMHVNSYRQYRALGDFEASTSDDSLMA